MVRLTDRPDMTLDVYRGRKTTMQQQQQQKIFSAGFGFSVLLFVRVLMFVFFLVLILNSMFQR